MASTHRFMIPSEYQRNGESFRLNTLAKRCVVLFLALSASLSLTSPALFATEEQPFVTNKPTTSQVKIADAFVTNTEQMIEQLIMQVEPESDNAWEAKGLADNPNPTSLVSSIPNIKPVSGSITSRFGLRIHPIYNLSLFHQGIDISASSGTNVQTTGDGIVAFSGNDRGYGQMIAVNHGYGYKTIYAHLSKLMVHQGQKVSRGDVIALSGNTGVSTGPHLHYEVQKNNVKVNPTAYFFNDTNTDKFISTENSSPKKSDNHL